MDRKIKILLAYIFGAIGGLVFLLIEKEDKEVRYHAAQSFLVFLILAVLSKLLLFIPIMGVILSYLISLATLVVWIIFIIKALTDKPLKLEFIKEYVEKLENIIKL